MLLVEYVLVPPEQEKYCVVVSRPGRTGMHYVTRRYHRMQRQKFSITCPGALFVESVQVPLEQENSASVFHAPDTPECPT
jgi:hypothetical protein